MAYKITNFIIAMVLISTIAVGFSLSMAEFNKKYHPPAYDNQSLGAYNKLDELSELASKVERKESNVSEKGVSDILGGYFSAGYRAMKLTKASYNTFDNMSNTAIDQAGVGEFGRYLKTAISTILLVIIVIGILLRILTKVET